MNPIPNSVKKQIAIVQRNEITEYYVYLNIAKRIKSPENRRILESIGAQEKAHHDIWQRYTGTAAKPLRRRIFFFALINFIFGYTFTLKIMERGEDRAKNFYDSIKDYVGEAARIAEEEDAHEHELINMLDEERLQYVGSMVLGLNDALVELTGTLAGLTLAFADPKLISLSGLITGIAASLSMASSEYLSAKADNHPNALKSAVYTGVAYIITVALMITPYLLLDNHFIALGVMLAIVVFVIFIFNFYISVAKDLPFKKRFFPMVAISLGVALISFGIGFLVKTMFGIEV
ncbi:MAG: VIT1/CCC1 transporter family protein [Bacillus subtilis]|nr:VIT1/CCC1 transporter family protein [Bacillus subtilis]